MEMSKNPKIFGKCNDLIPGLPYELALECLIRVPYRFHSDMKSVCHSWRSSLSDSSFTRERRRCRKAELLLCFVQPLLPQKSAVEAALSVDEDEKKPRFLSVPRFGLSVYNATTAMWNRVAFPNVQSHISLFCECIVLQDAGKVLLIGGWDPETLCPARDVYILEFSGNGKRWRRGASMKESRSFFACASVGSTKVYVAGGHDNQKNALRSAEVYDVEKDEWSKIPPMTEERDECQGFALTTNHEFCVLSGYRTESQGKFRSDGEIYDPTTNSWSKIENLWPFPETSPRGRVSGNFRGLCCFTDVDSVSQRQWESKDSLENWKVEVENVELPVKGSSIFAGNLGDEAMVMVSSGRRGREGAMITMKTTMGKSIGKWNSIQIPCAFSTLPFSHASIYV